MLLPQHDALCAHTNHHTCRACFISAPYIACLYGALRFAALTFKFSYGANHPLQYSRLSMMALHILSTHFRQWLSQRCMYDRRRVQLVYCNAWLTLSLCAVQSTGQVVTGFDVWAGAVHTCSYL